MSRLGGSGLSFGVFGFPVRVEWSFFLIAFFFSAFDIRRALLWIVVLLPSILVHELGHAFAARSLGAQPEIAIHGFGGLTAWSPAREPSRLQSIGVSLAGPGAGFVLGVLLLVAAIFAGYEITTSGFGGAERLRTALLLGIWINLGWGALNLLPILPLDGGHIMVEMMPGPPRTRRLWAAGVSVLVAVVSGLVLWRIGLVFGALLIGYFGFQSGAILVSTWRRERAEAGGRIVEQAMARLRAGDLAAIDDLEAEARRTKNATAQGRLKTVVVEVLASIGRTADARDRLASIPGQVSPSLYALVALHEGDPTAFAQLAEIAQTQPSAEAGRLLGLGGVRAGRTGELPGIVAAIDPAARPVVAAEVAASVGTHGGAAGQLVVDQLNRLA